MRVNLFQATLNRLFDEISPAHVRWANETVHAFARFMTQKPTRNPYLYEKVENMEEMKSRKEMDTSRGDHICNMLTHLVYK